MPPARARVALGVGTLLARGYVRPFAWSSGGVGSLFSSPKRGLRVSASALGLKPGRNDSELSQIRQANTFVFKQKISGRQFTGAQCSDDALDSGSRQTRAGHIVT